MSNWIDYGVLKAAASMSETKVTDWLALSTASDPYAIGTPRARSMAKWFKESVWDQAGYTSGVHLRRAHYWAMTLEIELDRPITQEVLKDGRATKVKSSRYFNTPEAWHYLCKAALYARYYGFVDIDSIVDNKNPTPIIHAEYNGTHWDAGYEVWMTDLERPYIEAVLPTLSDLQEFHIEVWCEKGTMNDVFLPLVERYGLVLCTFQGESSLTACSDFVTRVEEADKKAILIYVSDCDAAGLSMPKAAARKIEWVLGDRGIDLDVRVIQAGLTPAQVHQYDLPTSPMKPKEKRADAFMERTGIDGAVELDALEALHPGVLSGMIEDIVSPYFSKAAREWLNSASQQIRLSIQQEVDRIMGDYKSSLEALRELQGLLRSIKIDVSDYDLDPDRFWKEEHDDREDDWLFKSTRSYAKQIGHYKYFDHRSVIVDEYSQGFLEDAFYE